MNIAQTTSSWPDDVAERPALKLLRHALITATFCCLIAVALALATGRAWDLQLIYSLAIGLTCWAVVEVGRVLLPRRDGHQWPSGLPGLLLVLMGMTTGFVVGTAIGDFYCGCSTWQRSAAEPDTLRSSVVITIAACAVVSYFFHSRGKQREQQAKIALAERDAAQARLKLLQTQLEPHMLFNTLANLRVLIGADAAQATQMLDRLIDYLRATLVASRTTEHPLATEFDRLRDYLALMAVRMGPRLRYSLDLPPELADCPVPTLLLQPLVENSIRHGLEPQIAGGELHVDARRVDQQLQLEVTDSGVGPGSGTGPASQGLASDVQASEKSTGFGLAQVRERLATTFGSAASLSIAAAPGGGTRCIILLPLAPT